MTDRKKLLRVKNLTKTFEIKKSLLFSSKRILVPALKDVSFELYKGETLGLVGESGCGKSTLAKAILSLVPVDSGEIYYDVPDEIMDKIYDLNSRKLTENEKLELKELKAKHNLCQLTQKQLFPFRKKMTMIFQNPYSAFNPRMKIRDVIAEPLEIHKPVPKEQYEDKVVNMLEKVGLSKEYLSRFPREFSGGQQQRLDIARALILNPELVIADEPVSSLDMSVQAQIINLLARIKNDFNLTILFISHDLSVIRQTADRVAVMYGGRILETAPVEDLYLDPAHPYTQLLIKSAPSISSKGGRFARWETFISSTHQERVPETGCPFRIKCEMHVPACAQVMPSMTKIKPDHYVACHVVTGK